MKTIDCPTKPISKLIDKINHNSFFAVAYYLRVRFFSDDYLHCNYHSSPVSSCQLICLIKRCINSQIYQYLFTDIIWLINTESITVSIVKEAILINSAFRNTLLLLLAHKCENEEALILLNKNMDTPEAFYGLLAGYLLRHVPKETLMVFLKNNARFREEFVQNGQEIIKRMSSKDNEDLIAILKNWTTDLSGGDNRTVGLTRN